MKRFRCFVCGRPTPLRAVRPSVGLTCESCFRILEDMPIKAQRLMAYVFRRLATLEREVHERTKARRSV
jgi:hypothetical protein